MTEFIVIASAKGGTGKTTVALNLATALHRFGREVILLDANLTSPNLGIYLGAHSIPVSLHDVMKGDKELSEAAYKHQSGLKIIPSSISVEHLKYIDMKKIKNIFRQLDGKAEAVIVDSAPGLGEETVEVIKAADSLIIVTTPDIISVTDALRTIKIAEKNNIKILGIVLNRVEKKSDEMDIKNIEIMLEKPVIASIPEDDIIKKSLQLKHPTVYTHPNAPSSNEFKKLATNLIGQNNLQKKQETKNTEEYKENII